MTRIEAAVTKKEKSFRININDIAADLQYNSYSVALFEVSIRPQREDAVFV